jgi:hypothetical protein
MRRHPGDDLLAPLREAPLPRSRGDESGRFVDEVMRQVALRPSPARARPPRRRVLWLSVGTLFTAGAAAAALLILPPRAHLPPRFAPRAPQPVAASTVAPAAGAVHVRLTLHAPDARAVAIAGELNGWSQTACTRADDGTWTVELAVAPGRYRYSFVVDGVFIGDPAAALVADDDFGGRDAILVV